MRVPVIFKRGVFFALLLATLTVQGLAKPQVEGGKFKATETMRAETRYVVSSMESVHFNKTPLSQLDTTLFIKRFISNLDLNHLFFTQSEVNQFYKRFEKTLPLYLKQGNLFPSFEIFKSYLRNFNARMQWVSSRLEQPFDFNTKDNYAPVRKDAPWPVSVKEANDLWTKRLKYEILNELLSAKTASEETTEDAAEKMKEKDEKKVVEKAKIKTKDELLKEAVASVVKRYNNIKDAINKIEASEIQEIYLTTFTQMYDPHSNFLSSDTMEDFSASLHNSLVGIGAILTIENDYCTIRELMPGGPAARQGELKPNDQILGVGDGETGPIVDIVGQKLRQSVKLIRGKEGTKVRLLVRPAGEDPAARKTILITREQLKLTANLAEGQFFEIEKNGVKHPIGMIDIPAFYGPNDADGNEPSTTRDVEELIVKMKKMGMKGLILDLRRNGGGLLNEAISLTGLFIPIGPVVHVQDSKGQLREYIDTNPDIVWKGPLMLLVSKYSASASEIFAGALKSYNRAIITGDSSTHGKGTVQVLSEISRPLLSNLLSRKPTKMGATKLTIQKWYLPDGNSTQLKGVESHIKIPSINEYLPIAEADLDNPMPWDTIETIPWSYDELNDYTDSVYGDVITGLRAMSENRQKQLPEFKFLNENITRFKERQEQKEFSLNLLSREERRQKDREFRESMEERIKELAKNNFKSVDIKLEYVKNTEDSPETLATITDPLQQSLNGLDSDDKDIPSFDIYTRESLRIMADYLQMKDAEQGIQFNHVATKEELTGTVQDK